MVVINVLGAVLLGGKLVNLESKFCLSKKVPSFYRSGRLG